MRSRYNDSLTGHRYLDWHGPSLGRHRPLCSCEDIVTGKLLALSTQINVGLGSTYHVLLLIPKSLEPLSSQPARQRKAQTSTVNVWTWKPAAIQGNFSEAKIKEQFDIRKYSITQHLESTLKCRKKIIMCIQGSWRTWLRYATKQENAWLR